MSSELVAIARLVKPRGIKGEVECEILTSFPGRFEGLKNVIALGTDGVRKKLEIERYFFHKNRIVLKFCGFDSIDESDTLRGVEICVEESDAVKLEADEFFEWELVGFRVEEIGGKLIGRVKGFFQAGESVNLVIDGKRGEQMIPFVKAICTDIDVERKIIRALIPDGLLEL